MTDFERPVHDPTATTDPDTDADTTATARARRRRIGAPPPDAGTVRRRRRRPRRPGAPAASAAGRGPRSSRSSSAASAAGRAASSPARRRPRCPRLRAGRQRRCTARSASTCPATSAARSASSSSQVPGLRRPGRPRDEARRGPRPAGLRGHGRQADVHRGHQALVRRRARVQRRPAARAAAPSTIRTGRRGRRGPCVLLSVKDEALGHGLVRGRIGQTGATTTTETYNGTELTVFAGAARRAGPHSRSSAARSPWPETSTSVKAAVDTKGNSGFAASPTLKARARRRRPATTSGSSTSTLRAAGGLVAAGR